MNEPIITEAELAAEMKLLDSMRPQPGCTIQLNDLQFKLIDHARQGNTPVTWANLAAWWEEKGWGVIKDTTLAKRYAHEQKRRR